MLLPNLTDAQLRVIYATQFAEINVRIQDLVNAAQGNPALTTQILNAWQDADINQGRALLRLFVNQGATIDQLTKDFLEADRQMKSALQNLEKPSHRIASVAGLINAAVTVGGELLDQAPRKPVA